MFALSARLLFIGFVLFGASKACAQGDIYLHRNSEGVATGISVSGAVEASTSQLKALRERNQLADIEWVSFISAVDAKQIDIIGAAQKIRLIEFGSFPDDVNLSADTITSLAQLKRLERIEICGAIEGKVDFARLSELKRLIRLCILGENEFGEGELKSLGALLNLKELSIETGAILDSRWLRQLQKLEKLSLQANDLSKTVVGDLTLARELKELTLRGCKLSSENIAKLTLRRGTKLTHLDVVVDGDLSLDDLAHLQSLEVLKLTSEGRQTEVSIEQLRQLPALRIIELIGWPHLGGLGDELGTHNTLEYLLIDAKQLPNGSLEWRDSGSRKRAGLNDR